MLPQRSLHLECLETRQLLSSVEVFATGSEGNETFDVLIDDQVVASYSIEGTEIQVFQFETEDSGLLADRVRIQFTNDLYDPDAEIDRNLIVDKIVIDGVNFETEASSTYSTGTYFNGKINPGYWRSETLHTEGYFEYAETRPSLVQVMARGATGEEEFRLVVDDQDLGSRRVSTASKLYTYKLDFNARPERDVVRIEFTNDLYIEGQTDRDLIVDYIVVDGVRYETESPTTYSTGTWVGAGLPHEGYLESETLHVGGYFEYAAATEIVLRAFGDEQSELIELQIDQQTVATFALTDQFENYRYTHNTKLSPDQIRIVFSNDVFDPSNDIDTNVTVDWISIGGKRTETESAEVYSTGSSFNGSLGEGLGRGETLHVDGFFQFGFSAAPDSFSIPEDAIRVPLAILANDRVVGNQPVEILSQPRNGSLEWIGGELHYTPNPEFNGTDSFFYRLNGFGRSNTRVEINVRTSHQQPQHDIDSRVASELTPSGKTLLLRKFAKIPLDDEGVQPRMNSMTTLGDRIFVVTDGNRDGDGRIYELVMQEDGTAQATLFLDVGEAITQAGEMIDNSMPLMGLRSLAFHPDFSQNGKLFVTFTAKRPQPGSETVYLSDLETAPADGVLAEFTFDFGTGEVDPSSYREVFRVGMPILDHPIRQAVFNPYALPGDDDYGLLYIGNGDASEQSAVAGDGQNNDALGKILRINPLATDDAPFSIPESNPFVGTDLFPVAVYAVGFRNPHNLTFAKDDTGTVHLLATEIGRDNVEEINVIVAGGNYGWAEREGVFVHLNELGQANGINANIDNLPENEAELGYRYPVAIFGHDGAPGDFFVGQAITGSHVIQNGSSELDGQFIFVEFATDGRAYHIDFESALQQTTTLSPDDPDRDHPDDLTWLTPQELTILFDHDNDPSTTPLIRDSIKDVLDDEPDFAEIFSEGKTRADLRLGQGPNGELYILNKRNGWVYVATNTLPEE